MRHRGGVCLLSFDVGLNQGGAGPGPLFALFNTQYSSLSLFLSLHPSFAAFTCTMSAQPSVTPVDRSDLSAERLDGREGGGQNEGKRRDDGTRRMSGSLGKREENSLDVESDVEWDYGFGTGISLIIWW